MGRQFVYATEAEVRKMARNRNVSLAETEVTLSPQPALAQKKYLSDDSLFALLGFSKLVRLDANNFENVEELLDLNSNVLPDHLRQGFDVVLDFGTLEHVFHLPNCLDLIRSMVRPGGRILHFTPTSNALDHGFYSLSPTFFADYYSINGYTLNSILLCDLPRRIERGYWRAYDYLAGANDSINVGQLPGRAFYTYASVTSPKSDDLEEHSNTQKSRIPQ